MGEHSRWTYKLGSRAEGVVVYDDGAAMTSHHDTDVARGSHNSFDLVRLHLYGHLDTEADAALPITQRPSYKAMVAFALEQPEIREAQVANEFEDLGPLTPEEQIPADHKKGATALAKRIADVLKTPTRPRWLIDDHIERGVIALMAGPRGSYKSFLALDWSMRCALRGDPVYVISAEGGDYDRRARAWLMHFGDGRRPEDVPLFLVERRLNLNSKDGIEAIRQDCLLLDIRPVLFVLDTFSKLSGGLEENDNSEVKQFIGWLDNGLKRADTAFDATVLLVAHTGHSDKNRARGASALGADTDAEYIVHRDGRDGLVTLTRERFKSSPELPPLYFKSKVVDLDYQDERGRSVTSLVMEPTDPPVRGGGPQGTNQTIVYNTLRELQPDGRGCSVSALIAACIEKKVYDPASNKRDQRRRNMEQALNELIAKDSVFLDRGGETCSLTRVNLETSEDFEEQ